ncbi:MAG TPA: hypothetical protein VFJ24_08360 [Gaiellales bacterium]|nr:hypothetical protein [Gaiellales bacterium]
MRHRFEASVLVAAALAVGGGIVIDAAGCAHPGPTIVQTAECAEHQVDVIKLLPQVASALAADDYAGALATVVEQAGLALVKCAVQEWVAQHSPDVKASADPLTARQVAHGQAWLGAH